MLDAETNSWINSVALLMPDGKTLEEFSGVSRCASTGPFFGFPYATESIYDLGLQGGQGGSGLSSLGGTLREQDFASTAPIRHALKIYVWGDENLYYDPANPASCYRWPATRCDGSAGSEAIDGYNGANPKLVQGTLLAIPPNVTEFQLGLQTEAGRRFFSAMQDYGVYVVGNSNSDAVLFPSTEDGRRAFESSFGFPIDASVWVADVNRLLGVLAIVENNRLDTIGGGGVPRRSLAPPIGD